MGFKTEKELFDTAIASAPIQHLANLYYKTAFLIEPQGLFGVPDLVIASFQCGNSDGSIMVFAFEMKLSNWKRALVQAFRYRSFAEASYVLLDKKHIAPAIRHIERFQTANIGLMSIDLNGNVSIHHQPIYDQPYCERMRSNLEKIVYQTSNQIETDTVPYDRESDRANAYLLNRSVGFSNYSPVLP